MASPNFFCAMASSPRRTASPLSMVGRAPPQAATENVIARTTAVSRRAARSRRISIRRVTESGPDISVVIPAYSGARTIADSLVSVRRATAGRRCQVIVVESSGDAAASIIRSDFPEVELVCSPQRLTAGGARNEGALRAKGRLVFFTDQDCVVPDDWIARLERHLADPAVGAAGGSVGVQNPESWSGCAMYFLEFLRHFPRNGAPVRDTNFLVGCNSAYRLEALRKVSFPDRTLGEDVIFSYHLGKAGFGVVYDPSIEVRHFNRIGWNEFFRYNREMGKSSAVYHVVVRRWWALPFLAVPELALVAPALILPRIFLELARSRWSFLVKFLMLLPMCLAGNVVWANAFRRQVKEMRASSGIGT